MAAGALVFAVPGMLTGAVLRATRTSGWKGAWVGGLTGVATWALVEMVAAIAGSEDELQGILLGGVMVGAVGAVSGTVVGLTSNYPPVEIALDPRRRQARLAVSFHF